MRIRCASVFVSDFVYNMPRKNKNPVLKLQDPEEGQVDVDGKDVFYARAGQGPLYICAIPGEIGNWWTDYKHHLEWLNAEEYTMVAIDLPGYGKSRPPEREYHKNLNKDDADVAHAVMANLGLLPYVVFGWGESGRTALYMATNENKEHVKKMVIWGMQVNLTLQGARIYENCRNMRDFCPRGFLRRSEYYGEIWLLDLWRKYCDFMAKLYKEDRGQLCQPLLKEVEQPVLLIHGHHSRLPTYYVETLKNQLKNCKGMFTHYEGRHDVHNMFPDWFWERVEPFLQNDPLPEETFTPEQDREMQYLSLTEGALQDMALDKSFVETEYIVEDEYKRHHISNYQ